ncbi:MAG: Mov34/MPN/PAD-1 family protein [Gammaproteobacteria bacterium]
MVITDLVYAQIRTHIAAHAPERGGALYGPRAFPLVTHFECDPDGLTSSTSYVPSSRLIANVPRVERETGLQFKGIVHSHPEGFPRPSGGDEQTVGIFFGMNPHFAAMALPIVQRQRADEPFMRWYRAERREVPRARPGRLPFGQPVAGAAAAGVAVLDEDFHVLPISEHVAAILALLRSRGFALSTDGVLQSLRLQNAELVGLVCLSAAGHEFMYFVSIDYPVVPPLVLCQVGGSTEQLRFAWDGLGDSGACLQVVVETLARRWQDTPAVQVSVPAAALAAADATGFVPLQAPSINPN